MNDMTDRTDRKGTPFVSMKAALVPVLASADLAALDATLAERGL